MEVILMTEETKAPTEQTDESTTKPEAKPNNIDALERKNRELLGKLKSEKEKREEFANRLDKIEQERLESQGKYQDINKTLKERLESAEKDKKDQVDRFRFRVIDQELSRAALENGCKRPEVILRLLEREEKEMIQIDDSFKVSRDSMSPVIDRIKGEYPELFEKVSVATKDIAPTRDIPSQQQQKTEAELLEEYVNNLSK